jgi:hypothetical protein
MIRLHAAALSLALALALPAPAAATETAPAARGPTLEHLLTMVAQMYVMALRTQMDIKYAELTRDILRARVTLTDVQVWPLPDWDQGALCQVSIDRLSLRGAPLDEVGRPRFRVQAEEIWAGLSCLPPELRRIADGAGLRYVHAPGILADLVLDIPSGIATVSAHATVEGVASVSLDVSLKVTPTVLGGYLAYSEQLLMGAPFRELMDNVIVFHAQLRADDLGLSDILSETMPEVADPATGMLLVPGMVRGWIVEMNRAADPTRRGNEFSPAQRAFLDSVSGAWAAFLAEPGTLVLETQGWGSIHVDDVLADPRQLYEVLRPVLATAPLRRTDLLPAELLRQALTQPDRLDRDARRRAGIALARGEGAPRNVAAARGLLGDLALTDGEAALALADAVAFQSPGEAYLWALRAGAMDTPGAVGRLDRLEAAIGLPRALALQEKTAPRALRDAGGLAGMRDAAAAHLAGLGRPRSYAWAAAFAFVAQAMGDREARRILSELDRRARREGPEAEAAWAAAEAEARRAATDFWLDALPARAAP